MSTRLSDIKGFEYASMFVKFLNEEYLNNLLDGNIYMKNYKYFIELEKSTKEKGQGDKLELAHVIRSTSIKIIDPESGMIIGTSSSGELTERYRDLEGIPLFCVTHFKANDFLVLGIEDGIIKAKIDLPSEDTLLFEETFGNTAVILTNDFTEKMKNAASIENTKIAIGDAIYQDYHYFSKERKLEFDDMSLNILFWKDNFFKSQREARFVLVDKKVEDHYILKVGDIRDKSKVLSTKELLTDTEFYFEFNNK